MNEWFEDVKCYIKSSVSDEFYLRWSKRLNEVTTSSFNEEEIKKQLLIFAMETCIKSTEKYMHEDFTFGKNLPVRMLNELKRTEKESILDYQYIAEDCQHYLVKMEKQYGHSPYGEALFTRINPISLCAESVFSASTAIKEELVCSNRQMMTRGSIVDALRYAIEISPFFSERIKKTEVLAGKILELIRGNK